MFSNLFRRPAAQKKPTSMLIEPISMQDFFKEAGAEYMNWKHKLTNYDKRDPLSRDYRAAARGYLAFEMRRAAAATTAAGKRLEAGRGAEVFEKAFIKKSLLGEDAIGLRIYDRNSAQDLTDAERLIGIYCPEILEQISVMPRPVDVTVYPEEWHPR